MFLGSTLPSSSTFIIFISLSSFDSMFHVFTSFPLIFFDVL
jgi:hypothetical protein